MKKLHVLFAGLFLLGTFLPSLKTEAETLDVPQTCPFDYYGFIIDVRDENMRSQTIKAAFTMGYCQFYDIMALDDELDSLRENFRNAAFECADTSAYKKDYVRILLEQYFVANVQKNRSDVIREEEAALYAAKKEEILTALKNDMYQKFVVDTGKVTESTFNDYFDSWVQKYDDRIGDYSQCKEGGFAAIEESWLDFVETIQDLSIDIDNPGLNFKDNIKVDNDLDEAADKFRDTGKSILNTWDYYKNLMTVEKTEVEEPAQVSDLDEAGVFNFSTALEGLEADTVRATIEAESADRMAKYRLLYGEGGAAAATDMQSILEYLNQVISESNTKDLPGIINGASKVYDKQCD